MSIARSTKMKALWVRYAKILSEDTSLTNFHNDPMRNFYAKLLTDRQADRQTDKQTSKQRALHNLFGGGNEYRNDEHNTIDNTNTLYYRWKRRPDRSCCRSIDQIRKDKHHLPPAHLWKSVIAHSVSAILVCLYTHPWILLGLPSQTR